MPSVEDLHELDGMSRNELIDRARSLGAKRPELMTRVELRDEIVRLTEQDPVVRRRSRGWLGVARDLVASVVDSGLNLPGAAAAIRGGVAPKPDWQGPAPVATVTLAQIYVAQGHPERALAVLDEVLRTDPDHAVALELRERLQSERGGRSRVVDVTSTVTPADVAPPPVAEAAPPPVPEAAPPPAPEQPAVVESLATEAESPRPESAPAPPEPPPETFDVPACALAITKSALAVRYELERLSDGVTLRVLSFVPRREGPERVELDVPIDAVETSGGLSLPPPAPGAVVRAVLGIGHDGSFEPLAVAWVYDASNPEMALTFAPPGSEPRALRENLEAALRVGLVG